VKLLLDEGVPLRAADELRRLGLDARHILEIGMGGQSDETVLSHARHEGAVIVAFDSDFHRLLALSQAVGPSVIRLRTSGMDFRTLAQLLLTVSADASTALEAGALVTVTHEQIRIRKLPIET
jgi:predicted nuclease of predicted toxin-antitoxin system